MITTAFCIYHYHFIWYILGFLFVPRLTFMIWLSLYFGTVLPLGLMIFGWIIALIPNITNTKKDIKLFSGNTWRT